MNQLDAASQLEHLRGPKMGQWLISSDDGNGPVGDWSSYPFFDDRKDAAAFAEESGHYNVYLGKTFWITQAVKHPLGWTTSGWEEVSDE